MGIMGVMHKVERVDRRAVALASVDLNLLVVFSVLLDEASVTRAASRLGRTQSAVSHALDRLRETFRDPLFVRAGQKMIPTPRAEELRASVTELTARLHDLWVGAPPFDARTASRRFLTTASDYLQIVMIPPLVARLRREAPAITFEVHGPKSRLAERLARGDYDVAFTVALEDSPSLFSQRLFTDRFVCMVAADHPILQTKLDRAAYLELPHALISPLGGSSGYVDRALERAGERRRVAVVLPDFMVAPRVLPGTDLVLTLPARVARLFEGPALRVVEPPIELPELKGHLVWHERLLRDSGAEWLREMAMAVAGEMP